ncbi:MAG: hypothetical protein J5I52_11905 [Saprospiraceae bacterium]|nr:MAG: hypothetical protein UZ09_BCD002001909 [Bacteroidetes bacterium OLB9]MCO6464840.1 hypothetical protein [Saprospiraceae bacterium]
MNFSKIFFSTVLTLSFIAGDLMAKEPDKVNGSAPTGTPQAVSWREACVRPTKQIELDVNNVRARIISGGTVWEAAEYIVPKPQPGGLPVSALYSGGVWIGGVDRARNIKLSAVTYRSSGFDFFSGPLDLNGATDKEVCDNWDKFFVVDGKNVRAHANRAIKAQETGVAMECDSIPEDVLFWPGQGNADWRRKYSFNLPDQPLGSFWDNDENGIYNPCGGDFPIIEIRGCEPSDIQEARELIPDEMIFWIYNDNGGAQTLSGPATIQMEVQVQAFAYTTNDEINDMTFYRYKLINKANEDLVDCYFSLWVDPDLGCYQDDRIGCDIERSLAYVYNEDDVDGFPGSTACAGTNTYGTSIPVVGVDYFRGPLGPRVFKRDDEGNLILDSEGNKILLEPEPYTGQLDTLIELGMTSFTYAENGSVGSPPPPTQDPQRGREDAFYNYIRGLWADGTPVTYGGTGYNPGSTDSIRYVFPSDPNYNGEDAWSMCSVDMPFGDRRTMQATGPLLLQPGAQNELIIGVVFVPDIKHPCPDLTRLKSADDIAQALFDNCFDITDGPDAPDLTPVELDRELILLLSNEQFSNNFNEAYEEKDLQAPEEFDNLYRFEGYRIFQLANASVTPQELEDVSKAREVARVDVKNGVREVYNWVGQPHPVIPNGPIIWTPVKKVTGTDGGIKKSFQIKEDQFATGSDRKLINHKQYHYMVLAYAYNNWKTFDVIEGEGQKRAYLEGRNNVRTYTLVPRPIVYEELQTGYGDGPVITRIQGEGNPGKFLDMDPSMYDIIINKTFDGKIRYKVGQGPIDAKVIDPLRIKDGKYRLEITGVFEANNQGTKCSFDEENTTWRLTNLTDENNPVVLLDNRPLKLVKEYIINNLGFSVTVGNVDEPGKAGTGANGGLGATLTYKNPNENLWFFGLRDGGIFTAAGDGTRYYDFVDINPEDENNSLSRMGQGFFVPIKSTRYKLDENLPLYWSPAPRDAMAYATSATQNSVRYRDLNNVDIIFTSDKSKWSKCIVVETASKEFIELGGNTIGDAKTFDLRKTPSIDQNGNPLNDGTIAYSYFPGYAVDVETGKRLNIFFGENSFFSGEVAEVLEGKQPIGGDLIFNPSSQAIIEDFVARNPNTGELLDFTDLRGTVLGGQHYIYVTRSEYDGCSSLYNILQYSSNGSSPSITKKASVCAGITWTCVPLPSRLNSIDQGLIPNDLVVKLRVNNSYGESKRFDVDKARACLTDGDQPVYEFEFKGTESKQLATQEEYVGALANVNVVPNPYYAYASYETSQFTNVVKITNLPARAIVTIYSIDGSFIRQYNRDERGAILSGVNRPTSTSQVFPDLDWDMKNFRDIPVASGVYLIHISAPDYGEERTIKWFGIGRKFDPSGL